MPKDPRIKKVLVIGSGPIIIGQAAEFDYSGTQACRALKAEGIETVLLNSNPATIMTDPDVADHVYIEPMTLEVVERILEIEKPDSVLPNLGGQMGLNLESPFIPKYLIGYAARESMLLEFSSTVVALILAGKVGSNIASEIGTMRITEQIDALEIMGVNSASYLILPKIVSTVFFFPFLTILSMIIGVAGGYVVSILTGAVNPDSYIIGIQYDFKPFYITYSLIKSSTFAFIITSISGFYGYYADGNSLEVGRASTKAVVVSSIVILIFNLILTQVLLT